MMKKLMPRKYGWFESKKKGVNLWVDNDTYISLTDSQLKYIRKQLIWKFDRRFKEVI